MGCYKRTSNLSVNINFYLLLLWLFVICYNVVRVMRWCNALMDYTVGFFTHFTVLYQYFTTGFQAILYLLYLDFCECRL